MVVGEDLELRVEVVVQEEEAGPGCCAVAGWKGFEGVIDLVDVAAADVSLKHDVSVAIAACGDKGGVGVADGEEVRTQATDEPFEEDLEDSGGDERI